MTRILAMLTRLDGVLYRANVSAPSVALTEARAAIREEFDRVNRELTEATPENRED